MPELSQLLEASFSCEPHLYFFTGRYSEPCRFRHHVALGMLSLYNRNLHNIARSDRIGFKTKNPSGNWTHNNNLKFSTAKQLETEQEMLCSNPTFVIIYLCPSHVIRLEIRGKSLTAICEKLDYVD